MRSSVYIQETGAETVQVDTTASPAILTNPDTWYGFAFTKTAEHLGLEIQEVPSGQSSGSWEIKGTTAIVQENLPKLQRHIGLIARYGAQRELASGWTRDVIGRTLGELVQRSLPALPEDATLMRTAGVLIDPFANLTNNDGCALYYARTPHWIAKNEPARNADGSPIAPFHVRDIGGMLIGRDGRRAAERIPVNAQLTHDVWDNLRWLAHAKDTNPAEQIRIALDDFLKDPEAPEPEHTDRTDTTDYMKAAVSFPRETMREIFYDRTFTGDITFGDLLMAAVRRHVDQAMAHPETAATIEASRRNHQELLAQVSPKS